MTAVHSALSQWSARTIIQSLSFQLWLADVPGGQIPDAATLADTRQLQLIATGDRTQLQSLARYIQQKTQRVLAVAALQIRRDPRSASSVGTEDVPPQCLQLQQPLTYLQLCDLASVLGQYEQSAQALPSSLALPASSTEPTARNVISLRRANSTTGSFSDRSVAAARRKNRRALWASSAAAALFAVGLTTSLWSRDPELQQTAVESTVPDATEESFPLGATPEELEKITSAELDNSVPETAGTDGNVATTAPAPTAERTPAAGSATADSANVPTAENERPSSGTLPSSSGSVGNGGSTSAAPSDERVERGAIANTDSEANFPAAADGEADPTDTTISETQPSAPAGPSGITPAAEPAPEASDDAFDADAAPADAIIRSAPPNSAAQRSEQFATSPSIARAPTTTAAQESATPESAAPPLAASPAAPGLSSTVEQVRAYFQQRWQASAQRDEGPLQYRLQLSATGEVVSFAALNEASQQSRDRILPTDNPPTFTSAIQSNEEVEESAESSISDDQSSALQIILNPDGVVQVFPL
ncbi:MAG: hypothetical protein AAFQ74_18915 [Cyanobacteria bacterium J06623_4]